MALSRIWRGPARTPSLNGGALIDPAAHGGHRETDLAMLALFGAPHLDEILRAYTEVTPLRLAANSRRPRRPPDLTATLPYRRGRAGIRLSRRSSYR
jgi:hypothetical protein